MSHIYKTLLIKRLAILGLALGLTIMATLMPMNLFEKKVVEVSMPAGEILEIKEGIN